MIGRGKSRYAAHLRWKDEHPEPNLAGYVIVARATTAPYWEREIFAGDAHEFEMENVSIDDMVFGVKAVDADGNESLVSPFTYKPMAKKKVEVY